MLPVNQATFIHLRQAPLHKRLAALLFLIVLACILIPIGLAVILVLIVLYIVLSIIAMAMQVWRSIAGAAGFAQDSQGRRNVRVIVPERAEGPPRTGPVA